MVQENNDTTSAEMSVEEILSSIRQILTAEEEVPPPDLQPETGEDAHLFVDEPIDWTGQSKGAIPKPPKPVFMLTPQMQRVAKSPLLSDASQEKIQQACGKLSQLAEQKTTALTLDEAQVEKELRPLLKEWIDKNMPDLVEKIVTAEVQRFLKK